MTKLPRVSGRDAIKALGKLSATGSTGSAAATSYYGTHNPHTDASWFRIIASSRLTLSLVLTTALVSGTASGGQRAEANDADDWPQLLGPGRDGRVATTIAPWPAATGPPIVWRRPVGEGFSGPAVVGDRLILFHRIGGEEIVEAIDTSSGETLWSSSYPTTYRDDFGFDEGPRATPTVSAGRVFTFGAQGVLQATDLSTGAKLWSVDTHRRFGVRKGFFGAACSPLVYDGKVMVNVGATDGAGVVAFDATTGDVLWTATDHEASYSAPIIATINGRETALFFTRSGLVAIDPDDGQVVAEFPWRSRSGSSVNAATPLSVGGRIFISASYGTGAALLDAGATGFTPVWTSDDALTNHYATGVYYDGHLYGYHGRQEYRPSLRAIELTTGRVAWSEDSFGGGTVLLAGTRLLILRENGELILAEATADAFRPLARARILPGVVRAYPALAGGVLYARNTRELVAIDLVAE